MPSGNMQAYYATDVVTLPDSNYLVSCEGSDWQLMKLDRNTGDTIWTKFTPSNNQGANYYGGIYSLTDAGSNTYIARADELILYNANGDTIWTAPIAIPQMFAFQISRTSDGGFAYCGSAGPSWSLKQLAFVKTDSLGNAVFTSVFDIDEQAGLKFYPNTATTQLMLKVRDTDTKLLSAFTTAPELN